MANPNTYQDINNSDLFMGILVNQLSFPQQNTDVHWQEWRRHQINPQILRIAKRLAKHRMHILRLQQEQENLLDQSYQLQFERITPEDFQRAQEYLQQTHGQLIQAERDELKQQVSFLQQANQDIQAELATDDRTNAVQQRFVKQVDTLEKSLKAAKETELLKAIKQMIKDEHAALKASGEDKKSHDPMPLVKRIYERLIRAAQTELAANFMAGFAEDGTKTSWSILELEHLINVAIPMIINASEAQLADLAAKSQDFRGDKFTQAANQIGINNQTDDSPQPETGLPSPLAK